MTTDDASGTADGFHRPDDRFVPVRYEDLVDALDDDPGLRQRDVRAVAGAISRVIRQEVEAFQHVLDRQYAAFNPDRDTMPRGDASVLRGDDDYDGLRRHVHYLVTKANYEQLDHVQIESAITAATSHGFRVRIHPERVAQLDLYVRGRGTVPRRFRSWRRPFRGEVRDVDVFQRMVVVARLHDEPHVALKLFREIPTADVEALLPHAEVLMNRLDRLLIIGGGAGALSGIATKVFWFFLGGAIVASQLLWPAILAMGTMSVRSLLGYRRARTFRDAQRVRHLYERNLANNAAVLHTLLGAIAQEEIKEAVLAWACLASADPPPAGETELRARIESWLRERFGIEVTFDLPDALESLDRLDLWRDRKRWRVAKAADAITTLDDHWRGQRTAGYHLDAAGR